MAYLDKTGLDRFWGNLKTWVKKRENLGLGACADYDTLPVAKGGTGATTVAAAKDNLGLKYTGAAASARGSTSSLSLSASVKTTVPLDTWIARTDTAFTFSDNGIKCPYAGTVMVTGSVYLSGAGATNGTGCYITKGSAEVTAQYLMGVSGGVSSGAIITPVEAGDVLKLVARMSVAGKCAPNNSSTSLNIAYIK